MSPLVLFLCVFFACLLAHVLYDMLFESTQTNINIWNRLNNCKYNYLAIVYKDIRTLKLSDKSDDEIYAILKKKFDGKVYPFLLSNSASLKHLEAVSFVQNVVNNKGLLFEYVATPSFGKKEFKSLQARISLDEKSKDARICIQKILIDKSSKSVDCAMKWLTKLLTKPFVENPDEPDKTPKEGENEFSIFYIGKGVVFEESAKAVDYFKAITALKVIRPGISITKTKGHGGDKSNLFTSDKYKDRRDAILKIIKEK